MFLFCSWLLYEIASGFDENNCFAIKNENKNILENNSNNFVLKSSAILKTIPIKIEEENKESERPGIKRRRKIIIRRRLLNNRNGNFVVSKESKNNNSKQKREDNNNEKSVRRIIWKIVPLRKLSENNEYLINEENNNNNKINEIPLKTKTAKIILKQINNEENKLQRRMAYKRTLPVIRKVEEIKSREEEKEEKSFSNN
ncbi:Origin recognition complex subunit 1 [Meloidogyne graminicola]|uniref:Origin recognition complex subunit 1 n=1 Tax=Meloidogyne graminicola TaxID=189291 RepID=A0A8S9Z8S9_9BILA|nr:Origin recognition complex subunit 1 [Meloidogyne graminicola]